MDNSECRFDEVYQGSLHVVPTRGPDWGDQSSVYYNGEVGFEFDRTNKLALTRPTVTVSIPIEILLKESDSMKRLRYYLQQMENDTLTYNYKVGRRQLSLYDAETIAVPAPKSGGEILDPDVTSDPTFWNGDVSYTLERTNKLALTRPTITAAIPLERLGISSVVPAAVAAAAADCLLREFARFFEPLNDQLYNRSRPDNENGRYYIYQPGGEVLVRNTAYFALCPRKDYTNGSGCTVYILPDDQLKPPGLCFCVRMQIQLPEKKIKKTQKMLCADLPNAVEEFIAGFDRERVARAVELAQKQAAIREFLRDSPYCAFIANGSILPREKDSQRPMKNAVPFESTPTDEIEVAGVRGMGVKRGVTVITGGGYSGKSTLLDALAAGIYDHTEGDGRELVITDETAVSIAAEDGRSVKNVNISPFIKWLPGGEGTEDFSTTRASGSTSQAANIMEAIDGGSRLLLIDEDRSATNFMIRDELMKRLIEREPITPFTDRVQELAGRGVSTILVIGGSGEYLSVTDRVYMMDDYVIRDVTKRARELSGTSEPMVPPAGWQCARTLRTEGFTSYPAGMGSERLELSETGFLLFGGEAIDTRALHNLVTPAQANAIGFALRTLAAEASFPDENGAGEIDLPSALDELYARIARDGLDCIFSSWFVGMPRFMDLPRPIDLLAALNRMRLVNRK
ncbi:MAG: ATPase [Clostridia bacterium]|nr:ATPase [Clostridia bacterium]